MLEIARQNFVCQVSVGRSAFNGLEEGCRLEYVNRLGNLRLDELLFGHLCVVFGGLVFRSRLAWLILILICQDIPPGIESK